MFNYINDNLQNINDKLDKNFNLKLEGSMNDDKVNNVKIFGRRFVNIW